MPWVQDQDSDETKGVHGVTHEQRVLDDLRLEFEAIYERLEGLEEWADEMGYRAIQHKIQEAMRPVESVGAAAAQYRDGILVPSG